MKKYRFINILSTGIAATIVNVLMIPMVVAQISSSANYNMVDFLNSEASLETVSNSYILNDSIDYYGGVSSGNNYMECTGDYAVLSNCGQIVNNNNGGGGSSGGGGGSGGGSGSTDCILTDSCDVVDEDEIIEEKPEFVLPDIDEPREEVKPEIVPEVHPAPVKPNYKPLIKEFIVDDIDEEKMEVIPEDLFCEDLACVDHDNLKSSAMEIEVSDGAFCTIYVFGSYQFFIDCRSVVLIWILISLSVLALSGIFFEKDILKGSNFVKWKN